MLSKPLSSNDCEFECNLFLCFLLNLLNSPQSHRYAQYVSSKHSGYPPRHCKRITVNYLPDSLCPSSTHSVSATRIVANSGLTCALFLAHFLSHTLPPSLRLSLSLSFTILGADTECVELWLKGLAGLAALG